MGGEAAPGQGAAGSLWVVVASGGATAAESPFALGPSADSLPWVLLHVFYLLGNYKRWNNHIYLCI